MAYVITDTCIKDELCVDVCPTDCIHPRKTSRSLRRQRNLYRPSRLHRLRCLRSDLHVGFDLRGRRLAVRQERVLERNAAFSA